MLFEKPQHETGTSEAIERAPTATGWLLVAAALVMCSCGGEDDSPGGPTDVSVTSVEVTPGTATLDAIGLTVTLSAVARDASGNAVSGKSFTWSSSDEDVVTVNGTGVVTAVSNGSATVSAAVDGVLGAATVTVAQVPSVLSITTQPTGARSGVPLTTQPVIEVQDANGNLIATDNSTMIAATLEGPGTLGGTVMVAAVGGVVTFTDLSITGSVADGDRMLTFTATGVPPVTSDPIPLGAGPASRLAFTVQPSNVTANTAIAPAVQVTALDQSDNTATDFMNDVTVSIANNPTGGTLSGTTVSAAAMGVASFSDLSVDQAGSGYTLEASATGLASDTSGAFEVVSAATNLDAVSGDGQMARVSQALPQPFVVKVTNAGGAGVPGVTVAWSVTDGGGSLSQTSSVTDSQGEASTTLTLGSNVGANSVTAAVTGLTGSPVTFTADGSAAVTVTVQMLNIAFVAPGGGDAVAVLLGDTIQWTNQDAVTHTATSNSEPTGGDAFDSGNLTQGQTFIFVPNVRGAWVYFCQIHPGQMAGATITVQ